MESDIQAIFQFIQDTHGAAAGGALAALSAFAYGFIKIVRLSFVQVLLQKISPKLVWANWPKWVAALFVFGLTFIGALLSGVALGGGWIPAIVGGISAAIPVALGAMGVDAALGTMTPKPNP